ncbi:uncharacterized protein L203_103270 [Cryptococcus depauperatus CBS 7841]|uniref:Uncharacterized protein n=1 Tax=Cryptococcus depauperatus CBS 7841 TaxID=1295531 RepID=A0A1E3HF50_9TREE|nr:hypothetical protein L203_06581 [Cryptococcus depauperatus CBS 7841]
MSQSFFERPGFPWDPSTTPASQPTYTFTSVPQTTPFASAQPSGHSSFHPSVYARSIHDPAYGNYLEAEFPQAYTIVGQENRGLSHNDLVNLTCQRVTEFYDTRIRPRNPGGVGGLAPGPRTYTYTTGGPPYVPTATGPPPPQPTAPTNGTHGPVYEDPNERPFWEEAYKRERATGKVTTNADIRSALLEGLTSDAVHRYESVTQEIKNTTNAIQANEGDCRSWRRSVVNSLRHIIHMCENDTTPAADDIRKLTNDWKKYIETQSKWNESVNKLIQLQTSLESHVKDYRTLGDEYRTGNTTGVSFARANKLFSDFNERRRPLTDQTGDLQTAWKELSRQQRGFTDLPATGASRGSLLEMLSTLLGLQHR